MKIAIALRTPENTPHALTSHILPNWISHTHITTCDRISQLAKVRPHIASHALLLTELLFPTVKMFYRFYCQYPVINYLELDVIVVEDTLDSVEEDQLQLELDAWPVVEVLQKLVSRGLVELLLAVLLLVPMET